LSVASQQPTPVLLRTPGWSMARCELSVLGLRFRFVRFMPSPGLSTLTGASSATPGASTVKSAPSAVAVCKDHPKSRMSRGADPRCNPRVDSFSTSTTSRVSRNPAKSQTCCARRLTQSRPDRSRSRAIRTGPDISRIRTRSLTGRPFRRIGLRLTSGGPAVCGGGDKSSAAKLLQPGSTPRRPSGSGQCRSGGGEPAGVAVCPSPADAPSASGGGSACRSSLASRRRGAGPLGRR